MEKKFYMVASGADTTSTCASDVTADKIGIICQKEDGTMDDVNGAKADSDFKHACFVRGNKTGDANPMVTNLIKGEQFKSINKIVYSAATKKVITFGNNITNGHQCPITIYNSSQSEVYSYIVKAIENTPIQRSKPIVPGQTFEHVAGYNDGNMDNGRYNVLKGLADAVNGDSDSIVTMDIISAESISSNTDTLHVTKGSKEMDRSGHADSIAVGGFLNILGSLYRITALANNDEDITVDREYVGETDADIDPGTAIATKWGYVANSSVDSNSLFGMKFTSVDNDVDFDINLAGDFTGSEVKTATTDIVYSQGTYEAILAEEKNHFSTEGTLNKVNLPDDFVTYAVSGETYDVWNITYETDVPAVDGRGGNKHDEVTITLVVNSSASLIDTMMDKFVLWMADYGNTVPEDAY